MENVILAGIGGVNSSVSDVTDNVKIHVSKVVLDENDDKTFEILLSEIEKKCAICVVLLGQKPAIKDKIAFEPKADKNGKTLFTRMSCGSSVSLVKALHYNAYISKGCKGSECNRLYAECLERDINCILIQIPKKENISDFASITYAIEGYIEGLAGIPALL